MENDGGPAFPVTEQHGSNNGMPGMNLRQHYAGLAFAALIAQGYDLEHAPKMAFESADALIRAGQTPPVALPKPFNPADLTVTERGAFAELTKLHSFDFLPADVQANAKAAAAWLQKRASDDIPF